MNISGNINFSNEDIFKKDENFKELKIVNKWLDKNVRKLPYEEKIDIIIKKAIESNIVDGNMNRETFFKMPREEQINLISRTGMQIELSKEEDEEDMIDSEESFYQQELREAYDKSMEMRPWTEEEKQRINEGFIPPSSEDFTLDVEKKWWEDD